MQLIPVSSYTLARVQTPSCGIQIHVHLAARHRKQDKLPNTQGISDNALVQEIIKPS